MGAVTKRMNSLSLGPKGNHDISTYVIKMNSSATKNK